MCAAAIASADALKPSADIQMRHHHHLSGPDGDVDEYRLVASNADVIITPLSFDNMLTFAELMTCRENVRWRRDKCRAYEASKKMLTLRTQAYESSRMLCR